MLGETDSSGRTAVFDNWSLQLACEILEFGSLGDLQAFRVRRIGGYDRTFADQFDPIEAQERPWSWFTADHVVSLLRLLNALVLYDKVSHDSVRSFVWNESPAFETVTSVLQPVEIPTELPAEFDRLLEIKENLYLPLSSDWSGFDVAGHDGSGRWLSREDPYLEEPGGTEVEERALFYAAFAAGIGATYWPAPARADFLRATLLRQAPIENDVRVALQEALKQAAADMAGTLVKRPFHLMGMPSLELPGVGSAVLNRCKKPDDILPVVLELRRSKEAIAFRAWLGDYEERIGAGDLLGAAKLVRGVGGVLAQLGSELGIASGHASEIQLQVGVTPSVTIGSGAILSFCRRFFPRPSHLVFVRDYLRAALSASDVSKSVSRLFPHLPLRSGLR